MNRRRGYDQFQLMGALHLIYSIAPQIIRLKYKPPITILFLFVNAAIFYLPILKLFYQIPRQYIFMYKQALWWTAVRKACLIPSSVLYEKGNLYRIILSTLVHADNLHILYNLTSFLYKGTVLEVELGSLHVLILIVYLMLSTSCLYVLIAFTAAVTDIRPSMLHNCCVGFSGVIFGLKVIVNSDDIYRQHSEDLFGFAFPNSTPWLELCLASLAGPNVSFIGHLCGILAGMLYLRVIKMTKFGRQRETRRTRQTPSAMHID